MALSGLSLEIVSSYYDINTFDCSLTDEHYSYVNVLQGNEKIRARDQGTPFMAIRSGPHLLLSQLGAKAGG